MKATWAEVETGDVVTLAGGLTGTVEGSIEWEFIEAFGEVARCAHVDIGAFGAFVEATDEVWIANRS